MIDRSQFLEELKRNPALMHRIAVITAGEVGGNAPLEKQLIQAETIFNRAIAQNKTLEQVTREHFVKGDSGYYPRTTFDNGERIMGRPGAEARFNELVLKPVIGGSDKGTEKYKFAPTGNASAGTARERAMYGGSFAQSQINRGEYSKHAWDGEPNKSEVYVQHRGDDDSRIAALRKGGDTPIAGVNLPPPRPPGSIPNTAGVSTPQGPPGPQASGQPDILAPVGDPGDPRRTALYGPGPGQPARSAQPARPGGLGGAMRSIFGGGGTGNTGYAPPGRSTYRDPSTGHTILNPGGSGEEAMGITRDLGARPSQAAAPRGTSAPNRTTAPAPTPQPQPRPNIAPEGMQPPLTTTNTAVPDIVAPQLKTDPRRLSPFEINPNMQVPPPESAAVASAPQTPFDDLGVQRETSMARPGAPVSMASLLGLTAAGSAPPGPLMPPAPKPASAAPPMGDAFSQAPLESTKPSTPFGQIPNAARAPEEARSLAVPNAKAWQVPPPSSADASAAFSGGGVGLNLSPYLPPKTVDQQLQPEPVPAPQPRPGPAGFPQISQGLSPFEQWMWPQGGGWGDAFGFGGGGGGGWDMASFY